MFKNEIDYADISYGAYILDGPFGSYEESVKLVSADFSKLYTQKVLLPNGKGNIIYLLSNNFDNTIQMVSNKKFIAPGSYRRIMYPLTMYGKFFGRRFIVNNKSHSSERNKLIKEKTNLIPYGLLSLPIPNITSDNVFVILSDIYEKITPIIENFGIKRIFTEFYSEFNTIIDRFNPIKTIDTDDKNSNNKILLIDCESFFFKSGASLNENKSNPLFLLYLAYLRLHDLSKLGIDIDMLICYKNLFMKFNPAKITNTTEWNKFRNALFRIMNANLDDYTKQLSNDEKVDLAIDGGEHLVSKIVSDTVEPYTKMVSPETKSTLINAIDKSFKNKIKDIKRQDSEIKKAIGDKFVNEPQVDIFKNSLPVSMRQSLIHQNPIKNPLDGNKEKLYKSIGSDYTPLAVKISKSLDTEEDKEEDIEDEFDDYNRKDIEGYEDEIKSDVEEILTDEEEIAKEVLDDIQDRTVPLKNENTAPINSARDKKLREQQKKVIVKNETIEQILSRDIENVPIEESDKSQVLHTTNTNMHTVKFANWDKTYLEKLYDKDIIACFDSLQYKESPFYITSVEVKDTSDSLNLKDTWTVKMRDENNKLHTIKVDIPKFQDNRFMLINGTRWIILKQNFYNPLVKDTPNTVILTTNFNKVTINRTSTKSIGSTERIFALLKKTGDTKIFTSGDSSRGNIKYISSLEYDEISRKIFKFSSDGCNIYFSRDYINENLSDIIPADSKNDINPINGSSVKGNEFFIGTEGNTPIMINEDTGLDRSGRTISDIIEMHLPDEYRSLYQSIKPPKQLMYAECKMIDENIPLVSVLIVWIGLTKTLDKMGIYWKFDPSAKRVPMSTSSHKYIKFADGILEYEYKTFAELILNGLTKMKCDKFNFNDFNSEVGYEEFIVTQFGTYNGINELKRFYSFLLDPITERYCKDLFLPTDISELMIYAVKLLSDNAYRSKASDQSYRTRSIEIIPAILYEALGAQYKVYIRNARRNPMTLNQKCVINKLVSDIKTVEPYSTLNPVVEMSKTHSISTKGFKGSNSEHSYDEEKRSYDPSAVGKIAITTSAKVFALAE